MGKINWKVRFNRKNLTFIFRFIGALLLPVLTYMGLQFQDLASWSAIGNLLLTFVTNPYLIGVTLLNALNIIPDGTTKGLGDSYKALKYKQPNK